jgi:hypothetical protein
MVEQTHCGFALDPTRPELLGIESESVEELMMLALLVVSARSKFVNHREPRQPEQSASNLRFDGFD